MATDTIKILIASNCSSSRNCNTKSNTAYVSLSILPARLAGQKSNSFILIVFIDYTTIFCYAQISFTTTINISGNNSNNDRVNEQLLFYFTQ